LLPSDRLIVPRSLASRRRTVADPGVVTRGPGPSARSSQLDMFSCVRYPRINTALPESRLTRSAAEDLGGSMTGPPDVLAAATGRRRRAGVPLGRRGGPTRRRTLPRVLPAAPRCLQAAHQHPALRHLHSAYTPSVRSLWVYLTRCCTGLAQLVSSPSGGVTRTATSSVNRCPDTFTRKAQKAISVDASTQI